MVKKLLFVTAILTAVCTAFAQINIIPQPAEVKEPATGGTLKNSVLFFNDYLQQFYGFQLATANKAGSGNTIHLRVQKDAGSIPGSYTLEIKKNSILLQGNDEAGVFYGVQSLLQLLPLIKANSLSVPCVQIKDYPRFAYRGMHLDVGRHFFPVSFIKKYIDYLALHKMNYFHWHLTEDQGWRIEIKKYPELTTIGGYRDGTIIGRYPGKGNDNLRYGGYYTQDEIKDIVAYATQRYITVVPEIELPGHSSAAIAAYPWLSCFPEKETKIPTHPSEASQKKGGKKVQETWGVFEDIYCAGKDSTFLFLQNVMDEVVALFPSKYIHVGGDEAPKDHWKICPACQARIKKEGLKDEHQLQSYFIQRMEKYLNGKGRTLIGWDEILEGGLAPNAVVMSWRGEKGGIEAAKENHYVIMTPGSHMYFDHSQNRKEDSLVWGGYTSVQKVDSYEPIPAELPAGKKNYVMGAQANVWTEYMKYPTKVEYQIFPRMSALSEVLWSPKEKRNWQGFEPRLQKQFKRYDFWGTHYSRAYFDKVSNPDEKSGK
jgi:hexosaminidase